MRAILIDPTKKKIVPLESSRWSLPEMREAIGDPQCSISRIALSQRESLWLHDEGMLSEGRSIFFFGSYPYPLAGKGLILGLTSSGENAASKTTVADLLGQIQFSELQSVGKLSDGFKTPQGYHIGEPIVGPRPDWIQPPTRASFEWSMIGQIVRLVDLGQPVRPSVTNDAEAVFAAISSAVGPRMANTPVVYRDSSGRWDAMLPGPDGKFNGFMGLGEASFEAARSQLNAMFGLSR